MQVKVKQMTETSVHLYNGEYLVGKDCAVIPESRWKLNSNAEEHMGCREGSFSLVFPYCRFKCSEIDILLFLVRFFLSSCRYCPLIIIDT